MALSKLAIVFCAIIVLLGFIVGGGEIAERLQEPTATQQVAATPAVQVTLEPFGPNTVRTYHPRVGYYPTLHRTTERIVISETCVIPAEVDLLEVGRNVVNKDVVTSYKCDGDYIQLDEEVFYGLPTISTWVQYGVPPTPS
jgi:hypothetical protein